MMTDRDWQLYDEALDRILALAPEGHGVVIIRTVLGPLVIHVSSDTLRAFHTSTIPVGVGP